jgi:hypothetical protein
MILNSVSIELIADIILTSTTARNLWIELIQRVNVDPEQLVSRQQSKLLHLVLKSLDPNVRPSILPEGASMTSP